jgi:hypothetical protein
MTVKTFETTWVCTDCYFAHHYGATGCEPSEPLALLDGFELADNTDSDSGEGIDEFSWSSCDGCGSTLGGSRYRLAMFVEAVA